LTTRATGFLRTSIKSVVVVAGQNTILNLLLLPPPHLGYGQTITGTIVEPNEVFTYTFSGHAGDNVLLRLAEIDPVLAPQFKLLRPNGTQLCDASSSTVAQELCLLDATGKYAISVQGSGSNIGRYSLFLQQTNVPANADTLAYSDHVSGTVAAAGAMAAYTITGNSGDLIAIRLAEITPELTPDVRIYRPDGTLLCDSSSSTMAQELCALDANGTHTILAGSFNSEVGDFGLFLQRTTSPVNAIATAFGESKSGAVGSAGEMLVFTFAGSIGDQVELRMAEIDPELTPDVRLYRPDGTLLCDSSSSTMAQDLCLLDANGSHTILAGSFNSEVGDFSIYVQRTNGPTDAVATGYNQTKDGSVVNAGAMVAYSFAGNNGEKVVFRVAEVDPELTPDMRIYRPDGTLLCESTSSTMAQELCTLDATGSHSVLAGSFNSEVGAFTLYLQRTTNPVSATNMVYGDTKNGLVSKAGAMNDYSFVGSIADQVEVVQTEIDAEITPDVRLYRPDGTLLCEASSSTSADIHCVLDANGSYTILAGSTNSETGAYTVQLVEE
jgi:hypothetical protein